MSCISSNFSSFFLNSLNDPSEFSKYLSNGELKCSNFEEFQVFGCAGATSQQQHHQQQQQLQQLQQQQQQYSTHSHLTNGGSVTDFYEAAAATQATAAAAASTSQRETCTGSAVSSSGSTVIADASIAAAPTSATAPTGSSVSTGGAGGAGGSITGTPLLPSNRWPTAVATPNGHASGAAAVGTTAAASVPQHFDGSFEFIKYLRHSTDFTPSPGPSSVSEGAAGGPEKGKSLLAGSTPPPPAQSPVAGGLIDLDTSTSQKSRSASRKVAALLSSVSRASNTLVDTSTSALDVFDHDSKQTIFDLQHMASNGSSNSNESSLEMLAFPNSHLNASNSNTSSEGAACGSAGEFGGLLTGASCSSSTASSTSHAPKLLGSFVIKENFEVHPSHKVEEGIFQHMNKLPSKKKDTLKQLGVRFTGQMTLTDKSIVVENFIKFCEEYDIKDHRPWLSLNQCGLNKPEQIKFARYLGQGLPTFTLFCIYSNFKNLFCTKRTEIYTKDGYNLPYILDKTKRFLANTTAGDNVNNSNNITTNNTSNKTNNTTTTTTPSTPVKQTPQQQQHQQSEQELLAPNSPATPKAATAGGVGALGAGAGAVTPTQATPRTRPATPTMQGAGGTGAARAVTPTTPQQQHLQQQQQQHQQHMLQHPHMHPHPHSHPHAQHSHSLPHPHTHPHPHSHLMQPGTPTRSPAMVPQQQHPQLPPHPHHYPPHHPHHQAPQHHGHPHAHHFAAYASAHGHPHQAQHPQQQHHPHYYPHSPHPHPHAHVQHMAAMGYPGAAPSLSQQQQQAGGGGAAAAAAAAAAGGAAAGSVGGGGPGGGGTM
ncbi:LIM domain-containing protein A isoform X2 [Drosophila serrata]|uniref:LIM domain-containing protein A isoform X2 n=1 Tax=Drosophila serrata TaxID=7274 RepID=UPI000A1D276E|nr:LIM domain-containing protein A isoform X2 [Drosophila serrata]